MCNTSDSSAKATRLTKRFQPSRVFIALFCIVLLYWCGSTLYQRLTSDWYWAQDIRGFVAYGAHEDQYSPDAMRVAIAFRERCKILNLARGNVESELEKYSGQGLSDYSSNGMLISRFSKDKSNPQKAILWNASNGQIVGSIDAPNEDCVPIFSPDGKRIFGVFAQGLVIWDSSNLERVGQVDIRWPKEKWFRGLLAWNPANQELAAVDGHGRVLKIDLIQDTATPLLREQKDPVKSVCWSQDGTRLITIGQEDGSVSVWNIQTGIVLTRIPDKGISYASFSADGTKVVTSTQRTDVVRKKRRAPPFWDRSTKVWDATTGSLERDLPTVGIVTFSHDWVFVVETGPEGLRIARFDGSESCYFPEWFDGHGSSCVFAPDNSYLASVNGSGRVAIWRHRAPERFWTYCITGYDLWVALLAFVALAWAIVGFVRMPVPPCSTDDPTANNPMDRSGGSAAS